MLAVDGSDCTENNGDYQPDCTIADLFVKQAARTPEAVALIAADRRLTYREVDERSNRLARYLQSLGVRSETLVGVAMERSEEIVVTLLGILKAGGAYVPLDPSYPRARLSLVIEDAGLSIILTTRAKRGQIPVADNRVLVLETAASAIARYSGEPIGPKATAPNLAYVIYTSGSTGKPKGVMLEHHNVVNFFTGMDHVIGVAGGVWLAVTSIAFDISILELLWTVTRGFQVAIHGDEGTQTIADEISRYGVTHLQATPSLARILTLDPRALSSLCRLKQLLLGGEALPASLVAKIRSVYGGEFFNMYGPTETTIWSTTYRVEGSEAAAHSIPIGWPIVNTQTYLLDESMRPVPAGEAGELFIGGDGVGRGYWNRPELTAQRFLPNPFSPGGHIYRTGDLARYLPDGNIEFLGRADFQIKLRGHRIEPAEIEALLEQQPGVRQAVIVAREDRADDKRLVAYLTASGDATVPTDTLRTALTAKLPEYMIPSHFVFLKALPLTDNLKIDRNSLLRLAPPDQAEYAAVVPPENECERIIAEVWQEVLGRESIGRDDNFFDLGAHSLTVAEAHIRLQEVLKREFPLLDLFQYPTVRALAAHLEGTALKRPVSDRAQRRLAARAR